MTTIISRHITNLIFVKKIFIFLFVKVLVVLNLSCQKSIVEKPVNVVGAIDSISVTFNIPEGIHISADTSSNVLLDHTADIFLFAESLIELGRLSDREFFTELGHRIMVNFYADEKHYTSYSFCDNSSKNGEISPCDESEFYNNDIPYIGVALGVKDIVKHDSNYLVEEHKLPSYNEHGHPDCDPKISEDCDPAKHVTSETIAGLYSSSMKGIKDYIEDSQILESGNLESIETTDLSLRTYFDVVLNFLEEVKSSILEDTSEVPLEIKRGAAGAVETVKEGITGLQTDLNKAIVLRDRIGIIDAFKKFLNIEEDIEAISCPDEDTQPLPESIINPLCNSDLREIIIGLQALTGTIPWIVSWHEVPFWVFARLILKELADSINGLLPQIPIIIKDMIISEIEKTIDPDNIYNTIYSEARQQARQKIFNNRATLPGVELSDVKMIREGDVVSFSVDENSLLTTNGLTLGTAMSALIERLEQIETYERDIYSRYYQPLFSLFNKSLSMLGHYQFVNKNNDGMYEEVIPTSFFRPLHIKANQTRRDSINPYNYYGDENDGKTQAGYFAIPEKLVLESESAFTVDLNATQDGNMLSTVASQAEMIRGASKVLSYLRPDRLSSYDETMGALNLSSNTDQNGDISSDGIDQALFPKSSFFNLHLGIAGAVLTNLIRKGILIHTLEGESIPGNEFENDQEGVTPLLVSVYDVREGNQDIDSEVKTIDIAKLMIAVEEFMLAVEDIDQMNTPDLSDFSRKSYETVSAGIDKLKEVNLGFHFSMMIELQREDGCFVNTHNIVESHNARSNETQYNDKDDSNILLDTQIQSLLALTRFYKRSMEEAEPDGPQGGRLKRSILRGFNCVTEKLVDSQNNFYVAEEGTDQKPSLRLTTDFLRLLYNLDFVISGHDDWMQKLNDLRTRWTEGYIEQLEFLKEALPIPETAGRFLTDDWMHH